jgi:hypothetical protein
MRPINPLPLRGRVGETTAGMQEVRVQGRTR